MPKPPHLTSQEKSYFDTVRTKAQDIGALVLHRMSLDGKPVAVVGTDVFNAFTGKREGMMPLALILDSDTTARLREIDGSGPQSFSPHDLDPSK